MCFNINKRSHIDIWKVRTLVLFLPFANDQLWQNYENVIKYSYSK